MSEIPHISLAFVVIKVYPHRCFKEMRSSLDDEDDYNSMEWVESVAGCIKPTLQHLQSLRTIHSVAILKDARLLELQQLKKNKLSQIKESLILTADEIETTLKICQNEAVAIAANLNTLTTDQEIADFNINSGWSSI